MNQRQIEYIIIPKDYTISEVMLDKERVDQGQCFNMENKIVFIGSDSDKATLKCGHRDGATTADDLVACWDGFIWDEIGELEK